MKLTDEELKQLKEMFDDIGWYDKCPEGEEHEWEVLTTDRGPIAFICRGCGDTKSVGSC